MATNGLTMQLGFWLLFGSIMHIVSVAVMFIATLLMTVLSIRPKMKNLVKFALSLGLHGFGCTGNLALLWTFSSKEGSYSSQQFSLVATVVPGLIDGIMFAVLVSIYCNAMITEDDVVQSKSFVRGLINPEERLSVYSEI